MNLPKYYEFHNPVKINAGDEALETIPHELDTMNCRRPIIITDKGIVKAGLLKVVLEGFEDSNVTIGAIFEDTPVDSSLEAVNTIAQQYKEHTCDSIIAVGGGSVIDTAKGVNIIISEGTSDIEQFMGVDRLRKPQQPLIVIPTTSGTGSEVTLVAVISDKKKNVKMPFTSNLLMPRLAVLDPRMTITLPAKMTAATGMDALTHAIEAYTCLQKNPLSDAYAVAAIQFLRNNLLPTVEDGKNRDRRFALANASLMAGAAFSNSMVGAVHAISHACGGVAHVPHGVANSILLPYVMKFNLDAISDLYAELLLPLTGAELYASTPPSERARTTIEKVVLLRHSLNKLCGLPVKLSDAGVSFGQLDKIAETAINDGAMLPNPKQLSRADVKNILQQAY